MSKINTLKRLWESDKRGIMIALYNHAIHSGILNKMDDKSFLSLTYKVHFGHKINWENPSTFNEKLQWLKINNRNPQYIKLVDKYEVKNYVSEIIGDKYIIPTLGVWDRVEDVPFEDLPDQYVIKCTHDSGSVCICSDKKTFDMGGAKIKLSKGLKKNLFHWGREWPYKGVKPRIIAEEYLSDNRKEGQNTISDLKDYKLMCFNGKVQCSFVCSRRFTGEGLRVTFYDRDWNIMPFERGYPKEEVPCMKPKSYDTMVQMAEKLSSDIPFVRVDFYEVAGKPYFGELTFFPGNGVERFKPEVWDYKLGQLIDLKSVKTPE